jgi:hypothetical protein
MVASMKMAVFIAVVPRSLVEVYHCFKGACCLHHSDGALITLMMEAAGTLVNFYQTTWHNPEDSHLCQGFSSLLTHPDWL